MKTATKKWFALSIITCLSFDQALAQQGLGLPAQINGNGSAPVQLQLPRFTDPNNPVRSESPNMTRNEAIRGPNPSLPSLGPLPTIPGASVYPGYNGVPIYPGQSSYTPPSMTAPPQEFRVVQKEDGSFDVKESTGVYGLEEIQEDQKLLQRVQEATRTMSQGESDEARNEAKHQVEKYLGALFDADQKSRTKRIATLESQLVKLKEQVAAREAAKAKIVEMKLTMLDYVQSGLAFPSTFNGIQSVAPVGPSLQYPQPIPYPAAPQPIPAVIQ